MLLIINCNSHSQFANREYKLTGNDLKFSDWESLLAEIIVGNALEAAKEAVQGVNFIIEQLKEN